MLGSIPFYEFSVVLAAKANNPTILNQDFLKYNEIVPKEWELGSPPIITAPFSQIIFKDRVSIISQLDKIIFTQISSEVDNITIADVINIACKYIKVLPHVNYTGVGINPQVLIRTESIKDADHFIRSRFLSAIYSDKEEKLNIGFSLTLDKNVLCKMTISSLQVRKEYGVIIGSNFHHQIIDDVSKKIVQLNNILEHYSDDLDHFNRILKKYTNEEF